MGNKCPQYRSGTENSPSRCGRSGEKNPACDEKCRFACQYLSRVYTGATRGWCTHKGAEVMIADCSRCVDYGQEARRNHGEDGESRAGATKTKEAGKMPDGSDGSGGIIAKTGAFANL